MHPPASWRRSKLPTWEGDLQALEMEEEEKEPHPIRLQVRLFVCLDFSFPRVTCWLQSQFVSGIASTVGCLNQREKVAWNCVLVWIILQWLKMAFRSHVFSRCLSFLVIVFRLYSHHFDLIYKYLNCSLHLVTTFNVIPVRQPFLFLYAYFPFLVKNQHRTESKLYMVVGR